MAVVAPPPFKSNLGPWGSSDSAIYPAESPEPMTDIMSYQYPPPPPPQNGADMEMPPSGYMSSYQVPPPAPPGMDMRPSPDSALHLEDRRDSMSKTMNIKRSTSSPNVRPTQSQTPQPPPGLPQLSAQEQNQLNLAAEKRRNKLGYHRTSVACGHCRRRKIRCIPSPADVQGRCVNCIRLKKECSFYPVDQQPPQDTRQKSSSRSSVGPNIASASSSPAMQTGLPSDVHGQHPYSQLAMPSMQSMAPPMKPPGTESYSPEAKMSSASAARGFDYGHAGMTNWMSPDANPNSSKPGDLNATWRSYPTESPVTPAFSPYTPHAPPSSATWTTPATGEPSSRDDMHWAPYPGQPPRSLSFGTENMTSHPQQYPPMSHVGAHSGRPYDRKSGSVHAEMYPPAIATTIPGVETISGTTMDHHVSLSAGAAPPPGYDTWPQSYSYSKPADGYGGWYGDHGAHQPLGPGEHPSEHPPPGSNMYYAER